MSCDRFVKAVGTTRRITGDWSEFMGAGVSIASVTYIVPSAITAANESITSTTETNYYSGGVEGQEYEIVATVTTDDATPRIEAHSIILAVEANC